MSEYAWRKGGAPSGTSAMFVPVGTKATVEELIKGIIVQSGNDAAISVAENMGGNEGVFAQRMTEEARRLGLKKSVFKNATGLLHPEHQMTARELAMLARHIIKTYPDYYPHLLAEREFHLPQAQVLQPQPAAGPGRRRRRPQDRAHQGGGLRHRRLGQAGRPAPDRCGQRPRHRGRAPRRGARELLDWGFRTSPRPSSTMPARWWAMRACGAAQRMYVPLVGEGDVNVWLPRNPAGQKLRATHRLPVAAEAAAEKGRPGGHAARHDRRPTR